MFARALRILLAVAFYLGGAAVHTHAILNDLAVYNWFGEQSFVPFYRSFWHGVVEPNLPWIVLPVVAFELVVGLMMLGKGRKAQLGQAAGGFWNLLLAPLLGTWGWTNLIMVALHGWLYTQNFDRSAFELLRPKARGQTSARGHSGNRLMGNELAVERRSP
jgi:hypothetical protein